MSCREHPPGFPAVGSGSRFPGGRPSARRLVQVVFAVPNQVLAKDPAGRVLHSTVDVEDGLLAVAEECVPRGWSPLVLLEDPKRDGPLRWLTVPQVRTVRSGRCGWCWRS